ncbi:DUF2306 domain-containing protein [Aquimarina sp. M1]
MNIQESAMHPTKNTALWSQRLLDIAAQSWFIVAVLGQWIFAYYVATFYGGAAIDGDFVRWNLVLPHGYTKGETMNNMVMGIHLLFAVIIMVGGPLQFVPKLRAKARSFHRLNGKIYIITAFIASLSGMYLIFSKGSVTGFIGDISISFNGVLIMLFALLAWQTAVRKDMNAHQRWALRLFLVVNGVWFFRIGMMLWLLIHGEAVGFDPETFRGPFITFLGIGQYVVPLLILEAYLRIQDNGNKYVKSIMAISIFGLTILTGIGVFAATTGMWLPRL